MKVFQEVLWKMALSQLEVSEAFTDAKSDVKQLFQIYRLPFFPGHLRSTIHCSHISF